MKDIFRNRSVGRRAFLGGSAVVLGLPFLESLAPKGAKAAAAAPKRLLYYFVPNGLNMETFRPSATGAGYPTPSLLAPLDALKADFSVVTGLENVPAKPDGAGDHAAGTGSFITCAHAFKSETTLANGISADQVAANAIGKETRLPSLQLGISGGSSAGGCDSGYSCAYARSISWSGVSTPLPKITNPSQVFDQIFKGFDGTASQAEIERRRAYNKSVLDCVTSDATSLVSKLGKIDAYKVDEYMTGVRELERQLGQGASAATCTQGKKPSDMIDYPTKVQLMSDLMVLAMQCDATRIITFMLGNAADGQTYPFLNISRGHHDISHHGNDPANIAQLQKIGIWEMEQLAYLFGKMKGIVEGPDPASNMLYNSTIFFSSEISDGNRHNHDNLPVILGGHGGGALNPGRHIAYPAAQHQTIANLLVTTLGTVGVQGTVGNSTGPLAEL
ncbi:MAG TPA: DUF1552 domain-containing protein [Polyangiaceae bacterium]|nr:DUF1552 domain-containing protein [Polyangiaceae bacterium]